MRRLVVIAVAAAATVLAPAAGATPILDQGDAEELAGVLAEAEAQQDVCYGWRVMIDDQALGVDRIEEGSSRGVDETAFTCEAYVVFTAILTYTPESSEASDRATFAVSSNLANAPTEGDLRRIGVDGSRLLGNDDDRALYDAVVALPALAAERGLAPPVSLEENREALPAGDRPTGETGSDWLRTNADPLAIALIVLLGGLAWAAWIVLFRRAALARRNESETHGHSAGSG